MKATKETSQLVNNAQNGRQQQSSRQTAPPTDPRKKMSASTKKKPKEICRDFLWGKCIKGTMCIHVHKMDIEALKKTVKFCHNFQNKICCVKCNFLHVSSDEQKLFEKENKIPRLLMERYKSLNYDLSGIVGADHPEYGPIFDYFKKPPPPPPPPAPTTSGSGQPQPGPSVPRPPMVGPPLARPPLARPSLPGPPLAGPSLPGPRPEATMPPLQSMLALPPPPPPPLPKAPVPPPPTTPSVVTTAVTTLTTAKTSSSTKNTTTNTVSKSPVNTGMCLLNQPPPDLFDPSKPPPPFKPQQINGALKRPGSEICEAGQRKIAKLDAEKGLDCNTCVQRELRIELFKQEIKMMEPEQENKRKALKVQTIEHERAVAVLKSNIDHKYYQWFEDYIEGVTTSTKTVLLQVLRNMAANGKLKNLKLQSQSQYPLEDALLTSLTRRRPTNLDDSTRLLKVLGLLANSNSDRHEIRNTEINTEIRINTSSILKNTGPIPSPLNGFLENKDALNDVKMKLPPTNQPPPPLPTVKPGPSTQPPLPPCHGIVPYQLSGVSNASSFYNNTSMASTSSTTTTPPQPSTSKQSLRMKTNMQAPPRPPATPASVPLQNGQAFNFQYNMTMRYPPPSPYQ